MKLSGTGKRSTHGGLGQILGGERVRRTMVEDGRVLYAAIDIVQHLGLERPADAWAELKAREPGLASLCRTMTYAASAEAEPVTLDGLETEGVLRVVQSVPTARAERIRRWLAATGIQRLEEEKNPELAVLRTRRLYESKGYSRRWIDKRLRGVSARHELTGEWYKRGATDSDQYRALTNAIMKGAFGMEVEQYRQHKHLLKTGDTLRDHMSDLELALTTLGETVAVALHRDHDSRGYAQLEADVVAAGEVVAKTRSEIELRIGRPVVQSENHRDGWARKAVA